MCGDQGLQHVKTVLPFSFLCVMPSFHHVRLFLPTWCQRGPRLSQQQVLSCFED